MIFPKKIDDMIIQLLADHWELTVWELSIFLWDAISIPNLYKKIQHFLELHMLSKYKNKISLNKKRVLSYLHFADKLSTHHELQPHLESLEWSISHSSNSLHSLDAVWASLLSELNMLYKHKETNYIYHPHAHYMFGMKYEDSVTFSNIWLRWTEILYLVWNETLLDTEWIKMIKKFPNTQWLTSSSHKFLREWYCFNIVWDHIIEVYYPKVVSDYFELVFSSINNMKKLDLEKIINGFHIKAQVKLHLQKDSKKCDRYKKLVQKEFKKSEWKSK